MIELAQLAGLAALVALPLIIWLFSLRPKRQEVRVSSNWLWREALAERDRGVGLRKLLRSLSLLLLLIAALAIAVALARPQWLTRAEQPGDLVVIVDSSASMQTRTGGTSRFELALERAERLIDELPESDRLALMSSASRPVLRSGFETDRLVLRERLAAIEPTDEAGRPRAALELALSLLSGRRDGRVVFLTDGAFDDSLDAGEVPLEVVAVQQGEGGDAGPSGGSEQAVNFAITRFDVRPEIGALDRYAVLVTVRSYASADRNITLRLARDGRSIAARQLQVPAGERRSLHLVIEGRLQGRMEARIEADDDLGVDDAAYVVVPGTEPRRILQVGPPNPYLQSLFAAMPDVISERLENLEGRDLAALAKRYDLVVLDGLPAPALAPGNFLLFGTLPGNLPLEGAGTYVNAEVTGASAHSWLRGLDFTGISVDRGQRLQLREEAEGQGIERLLWSDEHTLALGYLGDRLRVVAFSFDLRDSNLGRHAVFPLLMRSSVDWLVQRAGQLAPTQIRAGEPYVILTPTPGEEVQMRLPSAEALNLNADGRELVFTDTAQAGFYRYAINSVTRYFAVNASSEAESDVNARVRTTTLTTESFDSQAAEGAVVIQPLWSWLMLMALALLSIEWVLWARARRQ